MLPSFLILLREALEAALVVGIVFGFLSKTAQKGSNRFVWFGVGAGILVSLVAAWLFTLLLGEFEGPAEQIFEGITMLAGGLLLFTLVIWLVNKSHSPKALTARLDNKAETLLDLEVFLVVFFSVVREGVEAVLFLSSAAFDNPWNNLLGGLLGIIAAIVLGRLLFSGSLKFKMGTFFLVTNLLLILFGAGLISRGIGEFMEAGLIPGIISPLWDLAPNLMADGSPVFWHDEGFLGVLLKSLLGYTHAPSLAQVLGYLSFLVLSLGVLFSRKKTR